MNKAIFLDKDGTVIEDLPYNVDPAKVIFLPGAWKGLRLFHRAGFKLVIVTNQSGPARGYYTETDIRNIGDFLALQFRRHGCFLSGFYYCPHLPEGTRPAYSFPCTCRKPDYGLFSRASRDLRIDCAASWAIGNMPTDVQAGMAAGCRTIFISRDGARGSEGKPVAQFTFCNLTEAALFITGRR